MHSGSKSESRVGVPNVVEPDRRQPGSPCETCEATGQTIRPHRSAVGLGEHEARVGPRRPGRQAFGDLQPPVPVEALCGCAIEGHGAAVSALGSGDAGGSAERNESLADVKIVAVTSPQLYEELRQRDPKKANQVLSDEERQHVLTLHNGWPGFLYPFLLPPDYPRRVFGMDQFARSGKPVEIYAHAGFDPAGLRDKILRIVDRGS